MALDGHIIEFLDSDQLRMVYVRKQERDKVISVDPRGRNLSVSSEKVVIVHRAAQEAEFGAHAREILQAIASRQSEIDVELLWQSLEGKQRDFTPFELAEIFFADADSEAASAIFRALNEDSLFFRRKGGHFLPKTADQVDIERTRRLRQKEREEFREHASRILSDLLKKRDMVSSPETEHILDRLHNWLRSRTGDEVGTILEEIAGVAKARDAAYDILLRCGRVDPHTDRFLVMAGIDDRFPSAVMDRAAQLQPYTLEASRVDYRHLEAFTIDDEDTREIDDALTIERTANEIIVGIHIADVAEFVSKGDVLDLEAYRRCSTIYLPAQTVRMFPEALSTNLASLVAGAPRPTFTVEVRFNLDGIQTGYRIVLGTIEVRQRLSYTEADRAIEEQHPDLLALHSIATALQNARAQRGAITFRRPELKVRVHGAEIEVTQINPSSPSRVLVSEMMILANGLAADFASINSLPVIFRTQEPRDALTIDDSAAVEALAFERLRKTFKRSRLSLTPGSHSGLGLTAYTQASSPIRRYADLVTQRQFVAMLRGGALPYAREELLQILATAEAAEQEIRAIEDRSTNYWLMEYLSREKASHPLPAIVLDRKGTVELRDFYLRTKISDAANRELGSTVEVRIENIDPARAEFRLKLA